MSSAVCAALLILLFDAHRNPCKGPLCRRILDDTDPIIPDDWMNSASKTILLRYLCLHTRHTYYSCSMWSVLVTGNWYIASKSNVRHPLVLITIPKSTFYRYTTSHMYRVLRRGKTSRLALQKWTYSFNPDRVLIASSLTVLTQCLLSAYLGLPS